MNPSSLLIRSALLTGSLVLAGSGCTLVDDACARTGRCDDGETATTAATSTGTGGAGGDATGGAGGATGGAGGGAGGESSVEVPRAPAAVVILAAAPSTAGIDLALAWSEEVEWPPSATLVLSNGKGEDVSKVEVTPSADAKVTLPFDFSKALAAGFRYRVRVESGGDTLATTGLDLALSCDTQSPSVCSIAMAIDPLVTNALVIPGALADKLDAIKLLGKGELDFADAAASLDPALRGPALRFATDLLELEKAGGGGGDPGSCVCGWAQNGPSGYKLPASPQSLVTNPTSFTETLGTAGPGAVLDAGARYNGKWWTSLKDIDTGSVQGKSERQMWLECIHPTKWQTIVIPIDYNNDGLVDWTTEYQVPIAWGPCPAPCAGTVDVFAETVAGAWASAHRPLNVGPSSAVGDSAITYKLNGAVQFNESAHASASQHEDVTAPDGVGFQTNNGLVQPVALVFEASVSAKANGKGRNDAQSHASASHAYALHAQAICASNSPAVSYQVQSYSGWTPDLCANITTFLGTHGQAVSCH